MMMMMWLRMKMGGLEGTNRLGGRAEQPITPLHTSNPKPTVEAVYDIFMVEPSVHMVEGKPHIVHSTVQCMQCMAYVYSTMEASEEKSNIDAAYSLIF